MGEIRTTEVKAIVNIDGEEVDFIRLKIAQEMGQHDSFEVWVDYRSFDETFHESPEKFLKKTNTKAIIDIWHADRPENTYIFSGMVESLSMISEEGAHGAILFQGKSNTIELERGEMMQTYSNTNLQTIFREITDGTMNLTSVISPAWQSDIDFAIQYGESDWRFLQRLCNQFQERFYYTGTDLVIGRHPEFRTVDLTYDVELRRFDVCSRLLPNRFSTYYYKRDEHKVLEQNDPGSIDGANNLLNIVGKRSDNLNLSRKPNTPADAFIPDMGSLIEHAKRRKVATGAKMMYVRGECKTCDVRIGRIVSVSLPPNLGGAHVGTYRVYSITHEFEQNGCYKSVFEAVPSDLEYLPTPRIPVPAPNLIQSEVWDNEDPEGMGRIKVVFPFDQKPCQAWIPVITPDAGGNDSGLGPASRGYSFIPEKSDTVTISFLDGSQLCHPVVVGSMFHGKNAENLGGGPLNNIKTIRTRSGHTIKFDDTKRREFIQIYDYKGNIIEWDTEEDTINISANSTINMTAVDVNIFAKKSFNVTAGTTISQQSGVSSTHYSGGTTLVSSMKDTQFEAGKALTAKGGKNVDITSGNSTHVKMDAKGNTDIQGKKKVKMTSDKTVEIKGTNKASISSKKAFVEGQSQVAIRGKKIKNN